MNITLTQLSYIVAVDTQGSFSKAAKSCYITQPTLSMQIQKLEDQLGIEVFDRSKKPIIPTDLGKEVIKQARVILLEGKKIEEILSLGKGLVEGDLRVGIIPTIAPYLLPLFVKEFCDLYPDVSLKVSELQTHQIIDYIQKDLIDVGILATPLEVAGLIEKPLFYEPFHLYLHEGHRLCSRKRVKMEDLNINEMLLLDEGHCFREQALNICKSKKTDTGKINFTSGNLDTLKKLVDREFGVTLLPSLMTKEFTTKDYAKVLSFNNPVPKREVSLIYGRVYLKKALIEKLEEVIIENMPDDLLEETGEVISLS